MRPRGRADRARAAPTRARCAPRRAGGRPGRPVARRSPAARERRRAGARGAGRARARPRRPSAGRPAAPRPARVPPAVTPPRGGAGSAPRPALHRARPRPRRVRRRSARRARRARAPSRAPRRPAGPPRVRARRSPPAGRSCPALPRPAVRAPGPNRGVRLRSRVRRRPAAHRAPATPCLVQTYAPATLFPRGERGRSPWNAKPSLGVSTRHEARTPPRRRVRLPRRNRRAQAGERRKSPPKPGVLISRIAFSGDVLST